MMKNIFLLVLVILLPMVVVTRSFGELDVIGVVILSIATIVLVIAVYALIGQFSEEHVVVVTEVEDGYMAWIEGQESFKAIGATRTEAIGELVESLPHRFGVRAFDLKSQERKK
jgi:hypothetical protein